MSPVGIYTRDNPFTYDRSLSFLADMKLMLAHGSHAQNVVKQPILWRTANLAWAATHGLRLKGDFVEVGCFKGSTAHIFATTWTFRSIPSADTTFATCSSMSRTWPTMRSKRTVATCARQPGGVLLVIRTW